jgi:hypothetical protein
MNFAAVGSTGVPKIRSLAQKLAARAYSKIAITVCLKSIENQKLDFVFIVKSTFLCHLQKVLDFRKCRNKF